MNALSENFDTFKPPVFFLMHCHICVFSSVLLLFLLLCSSEQEPTDNTD